MNDFINVTFDGFKIVANPFLADTTWQQVRFPRSKNRRIRKKWSRQRRNFAAVMVPRDPIRIGDTLFVHPLHLDRIRVVSNRKRATFTLTAVED